MQSDKRCNIELIDLFKTLTPEEAEKVLQFIEQLKEQRSSLS